MTTGETYPLTTTVELKLANPNAHKRRKLRETQAAYREALQAAFEADCATMSATYEIVVDYELTAYAKGALNNYVPQLVTDDAEDLRDEHPVRFTNEGIDLDHQPQNALEWYVRIPHHEDHQLWVPAYENPDQRHLLEALHADDAAMGEIRLIQRGDDWFLHITVTQERQPVAASDDRTRVGVDIGDAALCTVCHLDERGTPTAPNCWTDEGHTVRRLRETYHSSQQRLQQRGSKRIRSEYSTTLWNRIDQIIHAVTREVVEYAEGLEDTVLVLEDLSGLQHDIEYGAYMNRRLHQWAYGKIQSQIEYKAARAGIPVAWVDPRHSSKRCHACGELGFRPEQATFCCTNDDCWVTEYQADINAAANIAARYDEIR